MPLIPQIDESYLQEKGFKYDIVESGSEIHLILKDWQFPQTYTPQVADILIRLLPGYPMTPLDMFWTSPDIKLTSNNAYPETANQPEIHGGKSWQRWSRHTEWRAGVDNLRTFITAVIKEINRGI